MTVGYLISLLQRMRFMHGDKQIVIADDNEGTALDVIGVDYD